MVTPTEIGVHVTDSYVTVAAQVIWLTNGKNAPVSFVLDTGAEITSLSEVDVERMGIGLNELPHSRMAVRGVGGRPSQVFEIDNTILMFPCGQGKAYEYDAGVIQVLQNPELKDDRRTKDGFRRVKYDDFKMPSLLGIDFFRATRATLIIDFAAKSGKIVTQD